MDNVVTSLMVFEANGKINEYVGGYSDWSIKGGKLQKVGESKAKADKREVKPNSRKSKKA